MEKKSKFSKYEKQTQFRIKQLIENECNGSQTRFVEKTKLNKGAVSQYVNGKNTPSNATAKKIADAFDVAPAWVLGYDVPKYFEFSLSLDIKDNEEKLLYEFRKLNDKGKQNVLEHIRLIGQDIEYSEYLKELEDRFNDKKPIGNITEAKEYLEQANLEWSAFANKLTDEDIICIANSIKLKT